MPTTITVATSFDNLSGLQELVREYLMQDIAQLSQTSGVDLRPDWYVAKTFSTIDEYLPPRGRLLLARDEGRLVGMAFMKTVRPGVCEIKRMYVRPEARGAGIGRRMLSDLLDEARAAGHRKALLDSAVHMEAAHALYRAMGFREIDYYPEGENDAELAPYMVYMELAL
ncbi:GNAT family N-acetyltransferase [Rhodobacteraceae bacterium NNCM2]|nr:GNAT family N-acetyltransferase [Coraliihabitans acroporae]